MQVWNIFMEKNAIYIFFNWTNFLYNNNKKKNIEYVFIINKWVCRHEICNYLYIWYIWETLTFVFFSRANRRDMKENGYSDWSWDVLFYSRPITSLIYPLVVHHLFLIHLFLKPKLNRSELNAKILCHSSQLELRKQHTQLPVTSNAAPTSCDITHRGISHRRRPSGNL